MCSNLENRKIKVLLGIDEKYSRDKIANCFKFRDNYEVEIFNRENCQNSTENYDFYWLEYEDLDFENLVKTKDKILLNSFCIRKGLIRKAQIAFNLKKYLAKTNSQLANYLPETYVFELDYIDYLDEALNDCFEVEKALEKNLTKETNEPTKKFILKSSMTNKGAEILIFDTKKQLEDYFMKRINQSEDETLDLREWVIQAYLDKPLKLQVYQNRKFHLRVYVVAVGNLKVYVYEDILALFSLEEYKNQEKLDDFNNNFDLKCHITNTCVQLDDLNLDKNSEDYMKKEKDCVKRFWNLKFDEKDEVNNQTIKNSIFSQIKICVGEIFNCLHHEPTMFQPLENAFELYGFDFLIDENLNCFFLEANAFPDFKQTGDYLNDLIDCLFYQTIAIASDEFFNIPKACQPNKMCLVYDKKIDRKF
ncbi:unnamed protein product [Brachionus calyciflorus]|uniref:Uncharacterized protein n=1 Tax=Brachionus calyciflorus TaxID=104777 RepID=A0A813M5T5_9BILA|nr:unnamed protein product [Brachionus calyciflorus]